MKNKKELIAVLILIIVAIIGIMVIVNRIGYKNGKKIATSNIPSNDLQIRIVKDYIDIRKKPVHSSDVLGVAKEGSLFDVIDYKESYGYLWVHIKTDNNIEGYVSTYKDDLCFKFVNGDVDYIAPDLIILEQEINVNSTAKLTEEYINSIIRYSDDKDKNPKLTYEIKQNDFRYYMTFKVEDAAGNFIEKEAPLIVKNERLASNGEWVTYENIRDLRKKFVSITKKYGNVDIYDNVYSSYWIINFGEESTITVFTDLSWETSCNYIANDQVTPDRCIDKAGEVAYEEMKNRVESKEKDAKNAYLKIKEAFEKTGYKIGDLFIEFD